MANLAESRRLLDVPPGISLKELSVAYKNLMKRHHPDRFQEEAERAEAEAMSTRIIAAYKLLESVHPETMAAREQELEADLASQVGNWRFEKSTLTLILGNGSEYAFIGVDRGAYNKFVGSNGAARFVRRNLMGRFSFRRVTAARVEEVVA
ncbi:MAG: DnaJ domain-containing protein [Flavobacteriales bacterium]|nr:DnaJ domain-containing protein [Flavobacteriales bacterium]